jgi:hypothetical protein
MLYIKVHSLAVPLIYSCTFMTITINISSEKKRNYNPSLNEQKIKKLTMGSKYGKPGSYGLTNED